MFTAELVRLGLSNVLSDRRSQSGSQVVERESRYDIESERVYIACDSCLRRMQDGEDD